MKLNKKILAIPLASLLVLTAACSDKETTPKEESKIEENVQQKEVDKTTETKPTEHTETDSTNKKTEFDATEVAALENVILKNIEYGEQEKINAYMTTLSSKNQSEDAKASVVQLFYNFDIDYEVSELEVIEMTENTAIVSLKQKSVAIGMLEENSFVNNVASVEHHLIKEKGQWVLDVTNVKNVEYLD